ncbi:MAG TPA: hypothetical protein VFV40_09170 [Nocardioides sp.]|nr:hypothetical protein [Nocardioides sp.]
MTHPPGPPQPDEPQDGTPPEPTAPLPGWQPQWQPGWQPGPQGYGQPPAGPPGYGQPPGPPPGWYTGPTPFRLPDHPEATKALVVGIIALVGGFTCYLPLLLGPWAWVVGRRVVRDIDAEPGRWEGRGQGMGGYVMGVVATVLLLLGIVVVVGFVLFATGMMVWGSPDPIEGQRL